MEFNIKEEELISLSRKAGEAILEVYNNVDLASEVDYKGDDSPLTHADKASHEVIMKGLKELYPNVPIISEEGAHIKYEDRKDYEYYWLVDPLDGTKEFINRNGQFTVNIALMHKNTPVAGFIYTPAHDSLYVGIKGKGAYKVEKGEKNELQVNNSTGNRIAVRSKSHASPEEDGVLKQYGVVNDISVGSSLKFCMVAEGKADIYYRHGPTMEWDTAAGQAVLESAGGKVLKGTGPEVFSYNKENLLNSSFLCLGF
ncbi:3'(2'),5'-bisphosphate nucleotidase [Fulvivirga imtechensis AK7]|uniref:3'(2'),5'-bisphosphate nucleotidase CysQ n=1 Tax=Fulvivirga imtechensis AK7 TaxID=1237149 RepID=L8JTW6_9BACT|nr:3'(2'),5'-bisphosphate nucleotidase CysQ [Fulvivirga imtechensis]ELR70984.1 3'(2'),5'-bisphosphate nucleotidase [Fulvivirga imtechensis AK7]